MVKNNIAEMKILLQQYERVMLSERIKREIRLNKKNQEKR